METKKKTKRSEYIKEWIKKHPEQKKKRNEYSKQYRLERPNYMKEWLEKHPNYRKEWREKHPKQREKQAKYYREWYKKNGRKRDPNYYVIILKWREEHPESLKAMKIVKKAIKDGLLKKPHKCAYCKRDHTRINAHHEDYDKPLTVIWLCSSCHKKLHLASDSS